MKSRRLGRRLALAFIAMLLAMIGAFAILLSLLDRGAFNDRLAGWASARLHRPIRAQTIDLHLLSFTPTIVVRGLVVSNPSWIGGGDLAEVDRVDAQIELAPLLAGVLRARVIAISGAHLHLIRYGPHRNNWTFTDHPRAGHTFAPLASVTRLSVAESRIEIRDYGRGLFLVGVFSHDATGDRPFHFRTGGTLKGFEVSMIAAGGQLNAAGVGPAWPFRAHLVDAATVVDAQGFSVEPFDLSRFDLGIAATGPNLADLGYLFSLGIPNSGPYRLVTHARTDGTHFGFSNIRGQVGESDVTASVNTDHTAGRGRIIAIVHSRTLSRADVDAALSPIPPRAQARQSSGLGKEVATGRWILPDATFGLARLRASDFELTVQADRTTGYALPLRQLSMRAIAIDGLLRLTEIRSRLFAGNLDGSAVLDARADVPRIAVMVRLRDARIAQIAAGKSQPARAMLNLDIDMRGTGSSLHAAAGTARGNASARLTDIAVPRRAAWILGGDLLRALGNVDSKEAPASLSIACAAASVRSDGNGIFAFTDLGVHSALGTARGSGLVDLGQERLRIVLQGQPADKRLFQVTAPIRIEGSLLAPTLTLLPGRKAGALGLKGVLGLALTPVTGLLPIKGKPLDTPLAADAGC